MAIRANARYTVLDADGPLPAEMVRSVPAIRRNPLAFLSAMVHRYGDHVAFPMPRTPVLLVNSPSGARRVLVENHASYTKRTVQYGALSLVTGTGLLTADGEQWRQRRRIDQQAFRHGHLHAVAARSVDAAERLRARVPVGGGVVDVDDAALQATLEVVGQVLFGGRVGGDGERVVSAVLDALSVVVARARTPLPVPSWAPTPGNRRLRRSRDTLDGACRDVVTHRRRAGLGESDEDLLALLLRAADAGELSREQVRDELVTMVIAGHETVASSLAWTLDLLARHPPAQRRLHAELDGVLGGRAPGWADLPQLVWTRAVVDESLRLFPPAWVVSRRAARADDIDGIAVPEGSLVLISPWLLHRRSDTFSEPDAFRPERFLDGAARSAPGGAYLPFGAGPRLCIGRDFALVETVLILATLLRDLAARPASDRPTAVEASVTLRPRGGLPLALTPRQPGPGAVDALA